MRRYAMARVVFALLAALVLGAVPIAAAPSNTQYVAHLTRIADDVYRDWLDNLVVVTNGCLSLTLGEDAMYDDRSRQLTFQDGETCQVQGIYRPSIHLTRVDQDLYQDTAGQGYLRTRYCYVYTYGEEVVLLPDSVIFIESGQRCYRASL